jgi:DNA-binding NarL/FixJ family response regulator
MGRAEPKTERVRRGSVIADGEAAVRRPAHLATGVVAGELRAFIVTLEPALAAIAAPAVVLSFDGALLHANSPARAIEARVTAAVGGGVPSIVSRRAANADGAGAAPWAITPLGPGRPPVAFLAILHPTPDEQLLAEAVKRAVTRWRLTRRQAEVFSLVVQGLTNAGIADTLSIGRGTVEFHLSSIFDKAGVSSRSALIATALHFEQHQR